MNSCLMVFLGAILLVCCGRQGDQQRMRSLLVNDEISALIMRWDLVNGTAAEVDLYAAQFDGQAIPGISVVSASDQVALVSPKGQRELMYCIASKHLFRGEEVMLIHYGIQGFNGGDLMYETFDKVLISQDDSGEWRVIPSKVWALAICDRDVMKR
jgi:hypothetical protein